MTVHVATTDEQLQRIAPVLLQLRPSFGDVDTLVRRIRRQMAEGYQVAYVEDDQSGEILCVAGFVVATKLAWDHHVYVDDLVTAEHRRSTGAGATMIAWLKAHARELGCTQLHLDSGVQRFGAHRFYLREGFDISSHHFSVSDLAKR